MSLTADRVWTALITLGVVGAVWLGYWVISRIRWALGAANDLNERLTEVEKCKRPGL